MPATVNVPVNVSVVFNKNEPVTSFIELVKLFKSVRSPPDALIVTVTPGPAFCEYPNVTLSPLARRSNLSVPK